MDRLGCIGSDLIFFFFFFFFSYLDTHFSRYIETPWCHVLLGLVILDSGIINSIIYAIDFSVS